MFDQFLSKASELLAKGEPFAVAEVVRYLSPISGKVGDKAIIHLMGVDTDLHGTVESIAAGIEDRERGASGNALANINPTFSWVRLAQRVPVRIALDHVPNDTLLVTGRTATVEVLPGQAVSGSGVPKNNEPAPKPRDAG